MANFEIVLYPDPKLKKQCLPVGQVTNRIRSTGLKMLETMYEASGIGLAAPQVGILKRIFVMDCADKDKTSKPYICINPAITWFSDEKNNYEEGCLSIPDFYGEVERPSEIKVSCLNENGVIKHYHFSGLEAICAQHEIDHLNGILFIDYLGAMRRQIITSKMKKFKKLNNRNLYDRPVGE